MNNSNGSMDEFLKITKRARMHAQITGIVVTTLTLIDLVGGFRLVHGCLFLLVYMLANQCRTYNLVLSTFKKIY